MINGPNRKNGFYKSSILTLVCSLTFQTSAIAGPPPCYSPFINSCLASKSVFSKDAPLSKPVVEKLLSSASLYLLVHDFLIHKERKIGKAATGKACALESGSQAKTKLTGLISERRKNHSKLKDYLEDIGRIHGLYMENGFIYLTLDGGRLTTRFAEDGKKAVWDNYNVIGQKGPLDSTCLEAKVFFQVVKEKEDVEIAAELLSALRKGSDSFIQIWQIAKEVMGDRACDVLNPVLKPADIDKLFNISINNDESVSDAAIYILRRYAMYSPGEFKPIVKEMLERQNNDFRMSAVSCLLYSGDPECVDLVIERLRKDQDRPNRPVRSIATSELGRPLSYKDSKIKKYIIARYLEYLFDAGLLEGYTLYNIALMKEQLQERLVQALIFRHEEIIGRAIKVKDISNIYSDEQFIHKTNEAGLGTANQYSLARGTDVTLKRAKADLSRETINKTADHILEARKDNLNKIVLDKDTNLIIICHREMRDDLDDIIKFANGVVGIPMDHIKVFNGSEDPNIMVDFIAKAEKNTALWLHGDADKSGFAMRQGVEINNDQLAGAIKAYQARNGNDMRVLINSCHAISYLINSINLTGMADAPLTIASANRDEITKGNPLLKYLQLVMRERPPLADGFMTVLVNDFFLAEELGFNCQDFAFLLPVPESKHQQLMKDLGVKRSPLMVYTRQDSGDVLAQLYLNIRSLDYFEPLTQPGIVSDEGEKIGDGRSFGADSDTEAMCRYLWEKGAISEPLKEKLVHVFRDLQGYFKMINEAYPDKSRKISEYKIEFRNNVKHYAFLETEGDSAKIVIDTALLKLEDPYPFLLFVTGREGAHLLTADRDQRKNAAIGFDRDRFNGLNLEYQNSVLEGFFSLLKSGAKLDLNYFRNLVRDRKTAEVDQVVNSIFEAEGCP